MIAQIVGVALIPASMFGMQRKTPLIGDYLADARISILDTCQKEIKSKLKEKDIDEDSARTALTNIRMLRKVNDDGWVSKEEYGQLVQILTLVSKSGASTALAGINGQLTSIRELASRWMSLNYDEVATGVGRSLEELVKMFKKKK